MWFFIGWYEDDWFKNEQSLRRDKIECTPEQVMMRSKSLIDNVSIKQLDNDERGLSPPPLDGGGGRGPLHDGGTHAEAGHVAHKVGKGEY